MKKILSLLLAVIMLFSVVSVVSFAAAPTDAAIEISLDTKAPSYDKGKKDTIVEFIVSYNTNEKIYSAGLGDMNFGFDSSVFEPVDANSVNGTAYKLNVGTNTINLDSYPLGHLANKTQSYYKFDTALLTKKDKDPISEGGNGWDTGLRFGFVADAVNNPTYKKDKDLFAKCVGKKTAMFSFSLKLKENPNPKGNYTVGLSNHGLTQSSYNTKVMVWCSVRPGKPEVQFGLTGNKVMIGMPSFKTVNATVKVGAATPVVTYNRTNVRWTDGKVNPTATGKIDLGAVATFKTVDIPVNVDPGTTLVKNLESVGAEVKRIAADTTETALPAATTNFIYETAENGTYQFRAVVTGIPYNSTDKYEFVFFVTDKDGNTFKSEAKTVGVQETIAASKLPGKTV